MLAAASDLLLALACAVAALMRSAMRGRSSAMLAGWSLLGVAALAGTLRYTQWPQLAVVHRVLSDLAAGLGLPAVACGLLLALRPQRQVADRSLLAALGLVFMCAAVAGVPRVPGASIALLASVAVVLSVAAAARALAVLALLALLASAGFSRGLPQAWAIAGLHLTLAVAQLAWAAVWRVAPAGDRMQEMRSAQAV